MASGSGDVDKECRDMFMMCVEKAAGKELPVVEKSSAKSSAVMKLLKESLNLDQKTSNYVDASIFPKLMDKTTKKVTVDQFVCQLLPELAAFMAQEKKGNKDEKLADIKQKIVKKHQEWIHSDKPKNAAVVDRLTDVKGYTGSHKERFDADSGKGKGMEGRVDRQDGSGYVGAYKGAGTYDNTH